MHASNNYKATNAVNKVMLCVFAAIPNKAEFNQSLNGTIG
jgi:hypothetical protein